MYAASSSFEKLRSSDWPGRMSSKSAFPLSRSFQYLSPNLCDEGVSELQCPDRRDEVRGRVEDVFRHHMVELPIGPRIPDAEETLGKVCVEPVESVEALVVVPVAQLER